MSTDGAPSPLDWKQLYQLAVIELDPAKLPQRISDARIAILDRLRENSAKPHDYHDYHEHEELSDAINGLRAEETAGFVKNATRIAACVTSADGGFGFDLTPGRYLLRAGTVQSAGIKEIHAIFRVTGSGKCRKVKIRLSMGT